MDDPSRRFEAFFVPVCVEIRTRTGASTAAVADLAGLGEPSIKRFELGKNFPKRNLEKYAAAYAALDNIDPRDVFKKVVEYWMAVGNPPLTAKEERLMNEQASDDYLSPEAILRHISQAERASQREQEHAQDEEPPTSIRKRRGGGG